MLCNVLLWTPPCRTFSLVVLVSWTAVVHPGSLFVFTLVLASNLSPFCSSHVTISTFRPITGTKVDQRWCVFDNQGLGWPRTTRKSWNAGIFRSFLSWTTRVVLAGMFASQNHGAFECIKCSLLLVNFIVFTQLTVKGTWQICPLSSCSVGKWQIKYWWATLHANLPVCFRFTV